MRKRLSEVKNGNITGVLNNLEKEIMIGYFFQDTINTFSCQPFPEQDCYSYYVLQSVASGGAIAVHILNAILVVLATVFRV